MPVETRNVNTRNKTTVPKRKEKKRLYQYEDIQQKEGKVTNHKLLPKFEHGQDKSRFHPYPPTPKESGYGVLWSL
jgi:hypothetical protein